MRRALLLPALISIMIAAALGLSTTTRAMPEYATQVGEPCGTCHISPAGGGVRGVRGQAWVAEDKPPQVPSTLDALKVLGVQLPPDMSNYTSAPASPSAAAPLPLRSEPLAPLLEQLMNREGN